MKITIEGMENGWVITYVSYCGIHKVVTTTILETLQRIYCAFCGDEEIILVKEKNGEPCEDCR